MRAETEGDYRFHITTGPNGRGGLTTNDNPFFQVGFGKRSVVEYWDTFNADLRLGAGFEKGVEVETHSLLKRIDTVPPDMTKEDYAHLILHRIRAAGDWEPVTVVFTGPLGDPQPE